MGITIRVSYMKFYRNIRQLSSEDKVTFKEKQQEESEWNSRSTITALWQGSTGGRGGGFGGNITHPNATTFEQMINSRSINKKDIIFESINSYPYMC